jgi:hypothetical protein
VRALCYTNNCVNIYQIMKLPIAVAAPPIPTNGAEDTYNEFEQIYPEDVLQLLSGVALTAARRAAPDIQDDDIWASGFPGDYSADALVATDATKLARESSTKHERSVGEEWIGYEGDDSNEDNIAERVVDALRQEKQQVARELGELYQQGSLTPSR